MNTTTMFEVEVINRNERFRCPPDKSLLSGMEHQQQKAIQVGCRGGGCGVCKIRILSGKFKTKKMSIKHISTEQARDGYALSCRVFPQSDMVIEADPDEINKINE